MRIRHIYITKEGEPMANPEMEYPTFNAWRDNEELEEQEKAKYHSGLLPFEDRETLIDILPDEAIDNDGFLKKDTLIPVDLEAEVVEKWKFSLDSQWRDVTEDHGPKTEEEREAQGNEYRKVLRIKP